MSVFFVECPKIPFWNVSSLNCCRRLFKICTSYIISKCRWIKINIPWFLVPYFYLLSVQSYKRLKLRAFKEWLFRKTNGRQIRIVNTFGNVRSYFVSWKIYCLLVKKIVFMSRTEIVPIIFLRLWYEKRSILWNLFLRSQCFNKILSTKSKKEDI